MSEKKNMKHEIEVQFVPGDTVWHKNLATNKAMETKVKSYQAIIYSDGGAGILYHLEDETPTFVIPGVVSNTGLFATKEECDAQPPYVPVQ